MKKIFPILLFAMSYRVAVGLAMQENMWPWIVVYWTVLAIRNWLEVI